MKTNQKTYTITGATGQIGSQVATALLAAGHAVRVVTRDPAKVQSLVAAGAQAVVGASDDAGFLERAFRGADAVFALTPPPYGAANYREAQGVVGRATAAAIAAAGVRRVVNLSGTGAHLESTGPIKGLSDQERRLDAITGLDVVHLRAAYFLENLAFSLDPIRTMGLVGSPLRPGAAIPMIATKDIADAAVRLLLADEFPRGSTVQELHGPANLTMVEVTAALNAATGKALPYVQFPYDAAEAAMVQAGLSADTAAQMIEMYRGLNDGTLVPEFPRTAATTMPTTAAEFARGFAKAMGL